METGNKSQERVYKFSESCVFRKTKESFGGLSNMASGFPLIVNGVSFLTSEALYQACRFPHLPEVQRKIIEEKSPMSAKMAGKPFRNNSRPDWEKVRVEIMYWCLRVKLAQNFFSFGQLLASTECKAIVEDSSKDRFWGAVKEKEDEDILIGVNALGRLLMKLRSAYYSENRLDLLVVDPLNIPNFFLFQEPIRVVDERKKFIDSISRNWNLQSTKSSISEAEGPKGVHLTTIHTTPNSESKKQVKGEVKQRRPNPKKSTPKEKAPLILDLFGDNMQE